MLCFLPPIPAAPRPEPPHAPTPPPERAAEVVILIVIVLNVFFVLAALAQPLLGLVHPKSDQARSSDPAVQCRRAPGMSGPVAMRTPAQAASCGSS